MSKIISRDDFRVAFFSKDIEEADGIFYSVDMSRVPDFITPEEFQTYIEGRSKGYGYQHDDNYYHAGFIIDDLPDDKKEIYRAAYYAGVRAKYDSLLAEKDYQGLISYLFSFRGNGFNFEKSTNLIDKIFKPEDIVAMSKLFREMEETGQSDPNFFTYGRFCLNMAKSSGTADPFKNLRHAVPAEDIEAYLPKARWDDREFVIRLAVFEPKFQPVISEEFFAETMRNHLSGYGNPSGDFKSILQANAHFKPWFEKYVSSIFSEMQANAMQSGEYYKIAREIKSMARNDTLKTIVTPAQMVNIASGMAGRKGNEISYSEIFAVAAGSRKFAKCFTKEQVGAVADRLTTFPDKRKARDDDHDGSLDYKLDFKTSVDSKLSAFSDLVENALKFRKAERIGTATFNRAAIVYECGNNMNTVWEVEAASKLRAKFRKAFVEGRLAIKHPREGYGRAVGYDSVKDEFIFAPKAA